MVEKVMVMRRRLSLMVFLGLLAICAGYGVYNYPQLPEKVASHFGPSGRPDAWSTKTAFMIFYFVMLGVQAILFLGIGFGMSKIPISLINLPNKEYWLSEERKQETVDFMFSYFLWFGSATFIFLLDIYYQCFQVNLGKADSLPHFMLSTGLFIGVTIVWVAGLFLKFRKTR
jgi:uncharacterized membrane protein